MFLLSLPVNAVIASTRFLTSQINSLGIRETQCFGVEYKRAFLLIFQLVRPGILCRPIRSHATDVYFAQEIRYRTAYFANTSVKFPQADEFRYNFRMYSYR